MKTWLIAIALLSMPVCCSAQGRKSCEDLKSEIAAKLDANNVKGYSLEIVDKDAQVTDGKIVGTCDGGTKKIIYKNSAQ
jgi:Protein of unknown function (DUF1161)